VLRRLVDCIRTFNKRTKALVLHSEAIQVARGSPLHRRFGPVFAYFPSFTHSMVWGLYLDLARTHLAATRAGTMYLQLRRGGGRA
jgi:hypothetical protein